MILKHGQLLFLEKYSHLRPLESRRPRIAQKRFYLIECIEITHPWEAHVEGGPDYRADRLVQLVLGLQVDRAPRVQQSQIHVTDSSRSVSPALRIQCEESLPQPKLSTPITGSIRTYRPRRKTPR